MNKCIFFLNKSSTVTLPRRMCDYRRCSDWWMDLLTTHTRDSEPQAISTPLQISTVHKSPLHTPSLFQPLSPPAVPWQRLPTVEILHLPALRSSFHRLPYWTAPNWLRPLLITSRQGPRKKQILQYCSPTVALLMICCLATGTCLQRCPETVAVYGDTA
jgi:hypothetical protein